MNRLSDPSLPHRFTNSLPPETERPPTRTKLTWSEVREKVHVHIFHSYLESDHGR